MGLGKNGKIMDDVPVFRPVFFLLCLAPLAVGWSDESDVLLEKAVYRLKWSFVSVGTVTITLEATDMGHRRGTLEAQANAFMRTVHDFHTIISSEFPENAEKSLGYYRDEKANGNLHETFFDWEEGTVRYSKNGDTRVPLALKVHTQDPLSIVYAFRQPDFPFKAGVERVPVSDGEALYNARFEIADPENVKTAAGKFRARKVSADFGGVRAIFARPEGALIHVWLTDDERRLPVKLESEATIGSFRAVLEEVFPE